MTPEDNPQSGTTPTIITPTGAMPPQSPSENSPTSVTPQTNQPVTTSPPKTGGKRNLKMLIVAVVAAVVLLGGGAAAYFAFVVPNNPQTVFKQAITNTLKQKQGKIKGKLAISGPDSASAGMFAADYAFGGNDENQTYSGNLELTVAGSKVNVEVRIIDKNIYFKLGDFVELLNSAGLFLDPAVISQLEALNDSVKERWIIIDEALVREYGLGCLLDEQALSDADLAQLGEIYERNPFATIKEHKDDNVAGRSAIRYSLSFDKEKLEAFDKAYNELPSVKKVNEGCSGPYGSMLTSNESTFDELVKDDTEVVVWADRGTKTFVKYEVKSTASGTTSTFSGDIGYTADAVTKPEDATPLLDFIAELQSIVEEIMNDFNSLNSFDGSDFESFDQSNPTIEL